ncbi:MULTISPECIES: pyridoxal-dependent decarboxylase [unclassified Rhodococcus (in: high G+C Gram-positive bacteria)]|uniref:pyridoxal phosphate-dependent decarboxylase family protein n=1 Tax=unclassified Rhodococcus (in: high G+C Gram-positive bacteria) TaxID=192944 RepID=UPI0007D99ED6|nr:MULTISPECIES: pyridoxal-dependent decarboxylase [unclassified Rhodococcus (in: high G+C Gram-positive bacteria)]APE11329.1 hypothetical protein BO226_20770 [Rhodococcus sp. 2G]WML60971.1 pyridoxal-dependent decarboxylase [Rhodococcus sp. AH-ZY2]
MDDFGRLYPGEFLRPDESNIDDLVDKIATISQRLKSGAESIGGRRPIDSTMRYPEATAYPALPLRGLTSEQAFTHSLEAFEGAARWHDPMALFNLVPSPWLDTVALSTFTSLHNPNAFFDLTSGKVNLLEKRVSRMLGELAGWPDAVGIATSGGKGTLLYAIKAGLNRLDRGFIRRGIHGAPVVIASQRCHFSLESICNFLGLGTDNCIRLPTDTEDRLDLDALEAELLRCHRQGRQVACVIASGGGTLNLSIDDVGGIRSLLDAYDAPPYLHFDTVISWAWLLFGADPGHYQSTVRAADVLRKIETASAAVRAVRSADSFGADFHKTGLCPAVSSFFVTRTADNLVGTDDVSPLDEHTQWGDARYCDVSIENSRSSHGIVSAYHVLMRLGVHGMQDYLSYLLSVRSVLGELVERHWKHRFEVVNTRTLGFELVIKIHLHGDRHSYAELASAPANVQRDYVARCERFRRFITFDQHPDGRADPFIGYVARYQYGTDSEGLPAFLLYPISAFIDGTAAAEILSRLAGACEQFESAVPDGDCAHDGARLRREPPK